MSNALHRNLKQLPILASHAESMWIFDQDGKKYLDACGGAAVSNLGHNNTRIIDAIQAQSGKLPYAHTSFFTTEIIETLTSRLAGLAPGMDKVLLLSGGSETIEAALKLSRQYFLEAGKPDKHLFIARKQSYHGNTLGALAVGGNEWRRAPFAPLLKNGNHISACFPYRGRLESESLEEYGLRVANELESKIQELGAESVAAFIAETVVGATAGAVTATPGYFRRIREICDIYDVHLILDEVMCGTGRTGTMFAYEQENIVPDIVTMAKGLAAGYQPIGAMLCSEKIHNAIKQGSGFFQHGHTFMGHAIAAAAANETLNIIEEDNLLANVRKRGESFLQKLQSRLEQHPNIGDIRGRGLFMGIEFVKNKQDKSPFDPIGNIHKKIKQTAMQNGLMIYTMGGTIDGHNGDHVLLAPHYIIDEAIEDEIISRLETTINTVIPA